MEKYIIYTTVQMFGVSIIILFLRKINTLIQQGCIELIKSNSKDNNTKIDFLFIRQS